MLELSAYRLTARRTGTAVFFEFFEPASGRLVGLAQFDTGEPWKPGRFDVRMQSLFDSPVFRWFGIFIAVLAIPFFLVGMILRPPDPSRKPRLVVKRADVDEVVLEVRQSSGMFYDSRVVSDGKGQEIAQLRGPSKIALGRMSFGMIDLRGTSGDATGYDALSWLGSVNPSGDGVFRLSLVGEPEAGRVVEHRVLSDPIPGESTARPMVEHYDIEAGPGLMDNPTGTILLLATALSLAWRPPL